MADGQNLGTAVLDLSTDNSRLYRGLDDGERRVRGWQSTVVSLATKAALGISGVGAAATAIGFHFNNMKEQSLLAFSTMQGGMDKARAHWEELTRFAKSTPFELGELVNASKMLQAFRFEADQVVPMLTNIGDAVAATGGDLNRVVVALGQMQLKGKVSAQEMMQLAENNVGAWNYIAEGMGKTTAEVQKMAEQGLIPASQAIPMILEGMNREFGGLMEAQARTFGGMISNVKDSVNVALGELTGPLFQRASAGLERVVAALSSDRFDQWVTRTADGFDRVLNLIGRLANEHGPQVLAFAQQAREAIGGVVRIVRDDWVPVLQAFITDVLGALVTTFQQDVLPKARAFADVFSTYLWPALQQVDDVVQTMLPTVRALVGFLADHKEIVAAVAAGYVAYRVAMAAVIALQFAQKMLGLVQAFNAMRQAVGLATAVQTTFNVVLAANPIGIVVVAIGALVAAGVLLWRNWDAVAEKARGLWGLLREGFGKAADFISERWYLIIALLGPAGAVLVAFVEFKDEIFGVMGKIAEGVGKAIGWMIDRFNEFIDKVGDVIETARKIPGNPLGIPEQVFEGGLGGVDLSGLGGLFDGLRGMGRGGGNSGGVDKSLSGAAISAAEAQHEIDKLSAALGTGTTDAGGPGLAGSAGAAAAAEDALTDQRKRMLEVLGRISEDFQRREFDAYHDGGLAKLAAVRNQNAAMLDDTKALAADLQRVFGIDLPTAMEEAFEQVKRAADRMKEAARQAADSAAGLAQSWSDRFLGNVNTLIGQGITDGQTLVDTATALTGPSPFDLYKNDVAEALAAGLISVTEANRILSNLQTGGPSAADQERDDFRDTLGLGPAGTANVTVSVDLGPDLVVTGSP